MPLGHTRKHLPHSMQLLRNSTAFLSNPLLICSIAPLKLVLLNVAAVQDAEQDPQLIQVLISGTLEAI